MSVVNISNYVVGSLYKTMSQGSVDTRGNRLSRRYLPDNKAVNSSPLGSGTLEYVNNIRFASAFLTDSLDELSYGSVFYVTEALYPDTDDLKLEPDADPENTSEDEGADYPARNPSYAESIVRNLVDGYNSLYIEAIANSSDPKSADLASKVFSISSTHFYSLSDNGIDVDHNGILTVDTERLGEAERSGRLEEFFTDNTDRNSFANQLFRLSYDVMYNTANFVNRLDFGNHLTEKFLYSNTGYPVQYTYFSTGLIFDYLF